MPENSWPTSEELFRGDRNDLGDEVIYMTVAVQLFGQHNSELRIPLRRDVYDAYSGMSNDMLKSYIEAVATRQMVQHMTIAFVRPRVI